MEFSRVHALRMQFGRAFLAACACMFAHHAAAYADPASEEPAGSVELYGATMDGDPGWTLGTGWAWGVPQGGGSANHDPTSGYTGGNVIGYNLAGDYESNLAETRYATTPAVDCSGYVNIRLKYYRWLGVYAYNYSNAAKLQASNDGVTWTDIWGNSWWSCSDTTWQYNEFDISGIAKDRPGVQIRWCMGPTESVPYPGWNIDDVVVTGDAASPPVAQPGVVSLRANTPITVTLQATDDGAPISPGALAYIVTSLPLYGTLQDPGAGVIAAVPYTLAAGLNKVCYIPNHGYAGADSFTFKANDGGAPPSGGDSNPAIITLSLSTQLYTANMDSNPGWTLGDGWAWGIPQGGGSGNHDPISGRTGQNVLGYNLAGDYANDMDPAHATTPAFNCSGYGNVKLTYWRWLGVQNYPYDWALIRVSNNNSTWSTVWTNPYTTDSSWQAQEIDISSWAGNKPTVYVRWSMGPTDSATTGPGWNLDDVVVTGVPASPVPPAAQSQTVACRIETPTTVALQATDDAPGALSYIVTSLPASGILSDPGAGPIAAVPYTLASGGYHVVYTPNSSYEGTDAFTFKANDGGAPPTGGDSNTATISIDVIDVLYLATMETDPGWTLDPGWAWGMPLGGGSANRDPTSGCTGPFVIGYNPAGDYEPNLATPRYATMPVLDCTGYGEQKLKFCRWLGVYGNPSNAARVQLSIDGTNWTDVWASSWNTISDAGWQNVEYDIASLAKNQPTVYIRWVMGPTSATTYPGWNIDDVTVTGVPVHPPKVLSGTASCSAHTSAIITLQATDDGLPLPPALTYIVTSLPTHGTLWDPGTDAATTVNRRPITSVPHTLANGGNRLAYLPNNGYAGVDSFTFKANDGGVPPTGGDSIDTATITVATLVGFYTANMDTDPGWTLEPDWAWGTPLGGGSGDPNSGHTGSNVIGYNLAGNYPSMSTTRYATTPAINCSGFSAVKLTFYRWLGVMHNSCDHASIQVSNNGTTWTNVWSNPGNDLYDSSWQYQEFDISAVADDQPAVYIRFGMGPTNHQYPGWNIDDVALVGAPLGSRPPAAQSVAATCRAGASAAVTLLAADDGLPDPPGALSYIITSLPEHGTLSDPAGGAIAATALPYTLANSADHVVYTPNSGYEGPDTFTFVANDGGTAPVGGDSNTAAVSVNVIQAVYLATMDTDPNWTFDVGSPWAWGIPVGGGSANRDPTSGCTGVFVIGYNLAGDYEPNLATPRYATTPAIDCTGYGELKLTFRRWLGVYGSPYNAAMVQVSNDGTNWTNVWSNGGSTVSDAGWQNVEYDIASLAKDQPTVYIRWVMGATGSTAYPGWNIDDVIVTGEPPHPPTALPATASCQAGTPAIVTLPATDDGLPIPPGALTYLITSLPAHGTLWDPGTGAITIASDIAPYTLANGGNRLAYLADNGYTGTDSFTFKANDGSGDSNTETVSIGIATAFYTRNMDSDPGWTLDAGWAWGIPEGSGSGNHDPTSGYTGSNVIGYNLAGDYEPNLTAPRYATTPAIDCTGYSGVKLTFWRWLEVYYSDLVNIQVSNNGTTWTDIWTSSWSTVYDSTWQYQEFDISALADDQSTVYIRFGMGPTDAWNALPGWNIDDLALTGVATEPVRPVVLSSTIPCRIKTPTTVVLQATDDAPATLHYIVTSLPSHGTLVDPGDGAIATVPYTLANGGDKVVYTPSDTPDGGYVGPDAFTFLANDGGTPPTGGDSNTATVSINVINAIYMATMDTNPGWTLETGWAWGIPVGGGSANHDPTSGCTGAFVIGYNLAGDYEPNLAAPRYATTPAIDCTGYGTVKLSFCQWLGAYGDPYGAARIQVSNDGSTWADVWTNSWWSVSDAGWQHQEYDISAQAKDRPTVYIRWVMGPTGTNPYPGWNIDDVVVSGTRVRPPSAQPGKVLCEAGSQPIGISLQASDDGVPLPPAGLSYIITSLPAQGALSDPNTGPITSVPHTLANRGSYVVYTLSGTYVGVDSFRFKANDGGSPPSGGDSTEASVSVNILSILYMANMDANPGWTLDAGWAWGTPLGGGSANRDPTSGCNGSKVIGYNLAGDYENDLAMTRYATMPAVNCSSYANVKLSFYRWLGVESSYFDEASIQVSRNGTTWTTIWSNSTSSIADYGWQSQEFDISSVATYEPTVYIRWGLGPTDSSFTFPGWNIDDVKVTGLATPLPMPWGPDPADGQVAVSTNAVLSWNDGRPAPLGVTYDLYLDAANPPVLQVATGLKTATWNPGPMPDGTTWYWQVIARTASNEMPGAVWSFKTMIPGDVNADGFVDVIDLLYLVDSFGWCFGDADYDPACDFNSDGCVDVVDLLTVVDNFGK